MRRRTGSTSSIRRGRSSHRLASIRTSTRGDGRCENPLTCGREEATVDSFYVRVGGEPAVTEAVNRLYRVILADDRLSPYFEHVDIGRLKSHMVALLSQVLGGPEAYSGRDLRMAHAGLGISRERYDVVGAYLVGVLAGLGVDDEVLDAVRGVLADSVDDVAV